MANTLIGQRLKALREEKKLSQDDLARLFGFKDRQTVSAIETGERRLSADERSKPGGVRAIPPSDGAPHVQRAHLCGML